VRYALVPVSTTRPPPAEVALGEVATAAGFRRVCRAPEPLALVRLREVLLELASDGSGLLREGLEGFQSWRFLAAFSGTDWATGTRRNSAAGRRVLQRRLRALGTRPIPLSRAAHLAVGSPAHVRGTILPMLLSRQTSYNGYIWSHSAMSTDNVRLQVEEGHDFFLTDEQGETACVIAARGVLINADTLAPGDRISVFGYVDRILDPRGQVSDPLARGTLTLALRSGDDLPLLLRRVSQER
jgi:hypothetical protein